MTGVNCLMGSTEIWRSRAALTGVADDAFQAAMIQCDLSVDAGLKPGDDVPIAIDLNKIHIFRAANGQAMA